MTVAPRALERTLQRVFGLRRLRPGQAEVIERVQRGLSTLAVMPTGAGKSLCWQLPAVSADTRTLVVSPLVALMNDQCDGLAAQGAAVVQLHSGLPKAELDAAEQALADSRARVIFTTPERAADPAFVAALEIRFLDGTQRSFHPHFVQRLRARPQAAAS